MPLNTESSSNQTLIYLPHWPNLDFFRILMNSESVLIEKHENYIKQTDRNKTIILMSNGKFSLIIPVIGGRKKSKYQDIKIDYSQNWQKNYLATLQTAYGKSPFFEFYISEIEALVLSSPIYLYELNLEILTFCLKILKIPFSKINFTLSYNNTENQTINDFRHQKTIQIKNDNMPKFQSKSYNQTFGNVFVDNLSILDLVFNQGNLSRQFLL